MASHGVPRASVIVDKSEAAKRREQSKITGYLALETQVQQKIAAKDYSNETFSLCTALLRQNPEYYTIWNGRRLILQDVISKELNGQEDVETGSTEREDALKAGMTLQQREVSLIIKEDMQFLVPLLRQFPKCYWIWNHRVWLLDRATEYLPTSVAVQVWQGELGLVTKMLSLDNRNFHGWDYRRRTVTELERLSGKSMVRTEFDYTTKMIKSNLSNFSAWHNRSQLIPRLLDQQEAGADARKKLLDDEFELITTALYTDPYDQSLWFYHQYLMSTLNFHSPTNSREYGRSTNILAPLSNADRCYYLEQELDSIRDMLDGAEDCKYIYQALLEYAERYLEIDVGNRKVTTQEMTTWLDELKKLDPLRHGRWIDWQKRLSL